jgi:integrase
MATIQKYLESPEVTSLAKSTRDLYRYTMGHVEDFLSITVVPDETWERWLSNNLHQFAMFLEHKKLSGKSIQQYLTCTKIFLKWAGFPVEFTYKITNKDRQANKKKHLDRWFDEKDIEKCLAYMFENSNGDSLVYRTIVRLLVETGARVGEISGIRSEDVFLDERYVLIQGKTEPRPVIFSERTAKMLSQIIGGVLPFNDAIPSKNLFPEVAKVKAVITRMMDDLGLKSDGDGRGPHTLRHYTATYLFYVGNMRIEDLAFLLGDKVETIREKYLHPTPAMLRERVAKAYGWA